MNAADYALDAVSLFLAAEQVGAGGKGEIHLKIGSGPGAATVDATVTRFQAPTGAQAFTEEFTDLLKAGVFLFAAIRRAEQQAGPAPLLLEVHAGGSIYRVEGTLKIKHPKPKPAPSPSTLPAATG